MRKLVITAAFAGLGMLLAKRWHKFFRDDERPTIRVRNGSILVEADVPGDFQRVGASETWKVLGTGQTPTQFTVTTWNGTVLTAHPHVVRVGYELPGGPLQETVTIDFRGGDAHVTLVGAAPGQSGRRKALRNTGQPWRMAWVEVSGRPKDNVPANEPRPVVIARQTP